MGAADAPGQEIGTSSGLLWTIQDQSGGRGGGEETDGDWEEDERGGSTMVVCIECGEPIIYPFHFRNEKGEILCPPCHREVGWKAEEEKKEVLPEHLL